MFIILKQIIGTRSKPLIMWNLMQAGWWTHSLHACSLTVSSPNRPNKLFKRCKVSMKSNGLEICDDLQK